MKHLEDKQFRISSIDPRVLYLLNLDHCTGYQEFVSTPLSLYNTKNYHNVKMPKFKRQENSVLFYISTLHKIYGVVISSHNYSLYFKSVPAA